MRQQVRVHDYLVRFARDVSRYKTPRERTSGALETAGQVRGEPDVLDTIATSKLWQELARAEFPVTFHLTANDGDETDLRVQRKGHGASLDINVKATKAVPPAGTTVAACEAYGNLPVKYEEIGLRQVPTGPDGKLYGRSVQLERDDAGHVWACADERCRLADIYIKVFVFGYDHGREDPADDRTTVTFTNWLPAEGDDFKSQVDRFNEGLATGAPSMIPGINHPGLWVPPNKCRRYAALADYIRSRIG